jgi:hypothetical protein
MEANASLWTQQAIDRAPQMRMHSAGVQEVRPYLQASTAGLCE